MGHGTGQDGGWDTGDGDGGRENKNRKGKKKDKEQMPELYEVLNAKKSNFS